MRKQYRNEDGVGLIEVLITVLIMATALLALSGLQMRSLQFNHSAYLRSQANILAYDIIDRMRLNRNKVGDYAITFDDDAPTGTSLADKDVKEWREMLADVMPEGTGKIECNASAICTISIRWAEQNQSGNDDEDLATFEYSTRI